MPLTTLFLGSSAAAKSQARQLVKKLSGPTLQFLPWWEAFTAGKTILEDLDSIRDKVQGAMLLFSPESTTTIRGNKVEIPNLNVLFEFGYFCGHLGRSKVSMIKYGEFYLPSDFGGYTHISGSKFFKRGTIVQTGQKTTTEFERWVQKL